MVSARLIFLLVGTFAVSALAQPTSRILGGEEAAKDGFNYVCSIRLDGAHICGGSIISDNKVLTAAHCFFENGKKVSASRLAVRVGSTNQYSGGKVVSISDITIHPDYSGVKNDVAVLTLKTALQWTNRINKINIASTSSDEPGPGALVSVAGWGEQSSEVSSHKLHTIKFSIADNAECSSAYSNKDNSTICLAHELKKGSCTGDAGNGAVYNNKLIGVSSFVIGACGSRYPDIFNSVLHYSSWIESVSV